MVQTMNIPFQIIHMAGRNPLMLEVFARDSSPLVVSTTRGAMLDSVAFEKRGSSVFRTAFSKGTPENLFSEFVHHCHKKDQFTCSEPPEDMYQFELPDFTVFTPEPHIGTIWVVGEYVALASTLNLCILPHELARRAS